MRLRFQLLPCVVEVEAEDARLGPKLRYLSNAAEQDVRPLRSFHYAVAGHGPYEIREDGDVVQCGATPDDVLAVIYRRCHQRALDLLALGGWCVLHGGVARVGGRRLLVVGPKGTGKSTLMLRLLFGGHAVEGDELALVRDGVVVAFPRRLRLKPGTERLVPEVAPMLPHLPTTLQDGATVAALDPSEAGFAWRLDVAPVDAVVVAQRNHGGASELRELPPGAAVERLLGQSIRIDRSPAASARLVRACTRFTAGEVHELRLGDLREAVRALSSLGHESAAPGAARPAVPALLV